MKRKERKSEPVLIGVIIPEVMDDIQRRMKIRRNRETVGAKRNEHNRSDLRLQGRRRQSSLSELPVRAENVQVKNAGR